MFDGAGRLWACLLGTARWRVRMARRRWWMNTEISDYQGQRLKTNDLVFDASGGLWFTDPLFDRKRESNPSGVLPPSDCDSLVIEDLNRPNGVMLSPNEETLYVLPSSGSSVLVRITARRGRRRRAFGQVQGGGDGMTVDAATCT